MSIKKPKRIGHTNGGAKKKKPKEYKHQATVYFSMGQLRQEDAESVVFNDVFAKIKKKYDEANKAS